MKNSDLIKLADEIYSLQERIEADQKRLKLMELSFGILYAEKKKEDERQRQLIKMEDEIVAQVRSHLRAYGQIFQM